ncbi:MAG TPA: hydrogenase accessory protein HypB, partial [Lachnospiraceae bacterium]|nr:hydrogenase accessory protein HypB [Lachnospiraceae bacterium]
MDQIRVIDVKESVLADNDREADRTREALKKQGTYFLNVMSSPGSGKTTTLRRLIRDLSPKFKFGVMEADIDGDVDARAMQEDNVKTIQLHTGGMCHLDAEMSRQGLRALGIPIVSRATSILTMPSRQRHFDLVILENVGNLVCPAEFDTGADLNLVILSVPEGDDKPLKYPL